MNSLDEKIKQELERETAEIDKLLENEGGLPDLVSAMFKGGMRRWLWILGFFSIVWFSLAVWSGINFFNAETTDDRVVWGGWMLLGAMGVTALKSWSWMEMNRASTIREIKRLEIAIAKLAAK